VDAGADLTPRCLTSAEADEVSAVGDVGLVVEVQGRSPGPSGLGDYTGVRRVLFGRERGVPVTPTRSPEWWDAGS
jgi:hypothetical protein